VNIRIAIGRREFAPSWLMTAATVLLLGLFVSLGRWQWARGDFKQALRDQFERGSAVAMPLGAQSSAALQRFTRVSVMGRWDVERQFLLDNRTREGRAGYEVLTPLQMDDGRWLIVNRGWLPFSGYRDRLPDVTLAARVVTLRGRLDDLPQAGLASGRAAPDPTGRWPRVTNYPTIPELAGSLGTAALEPRVLLLDADQPDGFLRDWQPPGMSPQTHWSYAVQWWSFGVLLIVLYVVLNLRKLPVNNSPEKESRITDERS
jgi:surfeit locus 1 family protein